MAPYLENLSEKAIFESNQIKGLHKTMKFKNEEIMLKNN